MKNQGMMALAIVIGALTVSIVVTAPALAKSSKQENNTASSSPTETAKQTTDSVSNSHNDRQPGPAWRTIGGTVKHIKGDVYTVEDYEGNQVQLYVSRETKQLRGSKKVGDRVRAEITHGGFANSIQ
jgi:uncharacterized protein YdeI (BOF family)